jgi:ATP/maltotriose-dependent transcriptional regulator MalT
MLQAESLYGALGQERRVFLAVLAQVGSCYLQGNATRARERLESVRPTLGCLPAPLRARVIRADSAISRIEGDLPRALALSYELVQMVRAIDDWGVELSIRLWHVDLLWQAGSLSEAATEVIRVVEQLELRPLRRQWTNVAQGNLIGILSEAGRWEEASGFLRRFLPTMRGLKIYCLDALAHLFWCRGQLDVACRLLGASGAELAQGLSTREGNEHRLTDVVGFALRSSLDVAHFESLLAQGAKATVEELHDLVQVALEDPLIAPRQSLNTPVTPDG